MQTMSGGSTALHGFLYQLLAHLDWAATLTVNSDGEDQNLVLEPVGGSDAEMTVDGRRLIEQYKTRQGGSWSIQDIVRGPIADFVRTATNRHSAADEFRFVTDGRVEHQRLLSGFLSRTSECMRRGTKLDNQTRRKYRMQGEKTDSEMLDWIRTQVASSLKLKDSPAYDVVIHVLARTQLIGAVQEEAMRLNVEDFLRRCLPNPDDAPDKIMALIGSLVERLAKGPLSLNAREFLDDQGVYPERAQLLANLNRRLRKILAQTTMRGSHQYRPSHDVRNPPPWDIASKQILALAAPPGTGKSWQLLRLGYALGERGLPCVYAPLQNDLLRTLDAAARVVWNEALGTPTICDIASLKQALIRAKQPVGGGPWLVLLIDGPIDDAGIQQLIDFAAGDAEIRFAVTTSLAVCQRLRARPSPMVELVEVKAFDNDELCSYLELNNLTWADLPTDLFSLLKLPLLASLYVRSSPETFARSPHSEYELFEALWNRVSERTSGLAAVAHLRTLARAFAAQPDAISLAVEHALPHATDDTLRALTDAGWLDFDSRAHVRFAHDRLMNWALADAVVTDIHTALPTADQIPKTFMLPWSTRTRWGYVLMDVFWKLCSDEAGSKHAARLLKELRSDDLGIPEHTLYEDLLPTLGPRAILLLTALLDEEGDKQLAPRLTQCARHISRQYRTRFYDDQIKVSTRRWLNTSSRTAVHLGLILVEAGGLSSLADEVLRVHLIHAEGLCCTPPDHSSYQLSFSALKSCVRENPAWLDKTIEETCDPASLSALSWQLLNLEDEGAENIWRKHRSRLVEQAAPHFLRGALSCIRRFRDTTLVEFARSALASTNDFDPGVALLTLATIAPDIAFDVFASSAPSEFFYVRDSLFVTLHRVRPVACEDWLLRHLDEGSTYELFELIESDASSGLGHSVVSAFRRAVTARLTSDNPWLHRWKQLLSRMRDRDAVYALASTNTEQELLGIASRRIDPTRMWHDHLLGDVRDVLVAIGGPGLQALLAKELQLTRGRAAHKALTLLPMVSWSNVATSLADHVASASRATGDDGLLSSYGAFNAMAVLDCHDTLATLVRNSDPHKFPLEAVEIRHGGKPFSPDLVASIVTNLALVGDNEIERLRELILASLAQAPELTTVIEQILLNEAINQTEFVFAAQALMALGDVVSERVALANRRWLDEKEVSQHALRLLFRCGSLECRRSLLEFGRARLATNPILAGEIAARLPEEGADALIATQLAISAFHRLDMATATYSRVARFGGPAEHALLKQRAFRTDQGLIDVRREAIRAWHLVDPAEAVEAGLWALEQGNSLDLFATSFVMRRGSQEQCVRLLDLTMDLGRDALWCHAGRALRQQSRDGAIALIEHYRLGSSLTARRVFATMAGWLGDHYFDEVRSRMRTEHSPAVLKALEQAAARMTQLSTLREHLNALSDAQGAHRLSAIHACLAMDEPFLLNCESDELWIGHALKNHPSYFLRFSERELDRLCKAWKPPTH